MFSIAGSEAVHDPGMAARSHPRGHRTTASAGRPDRSPRRPSGAVIAGVLAMVLVSMLLPGRGAIAAPGSRTYEQQAFLKAAVSAADDRNGSSAAIDGDTAVVGAPAYRGLGRAGRVTVYVRDGAAWQLAATLVPSDTAANDEFGKSVALQGDTLVVGAPWAATSGAAYVFTRSDGTWTEAAILTGTAADAGLFGSSVAIDGGTIAVGGLWDGSGGTTVGGAITVFTGAGSTWSRQAVLTGSRGGANDQLGTAVAIAGDTIIGGAYLEDHDGTDPENDNLANSGAAYVFVRSGTTWTEQAYLKAPTPEAGANFGASVAVDGDTALVGAPKEDPGGVSAAGSVHVFTRSGATWTFAATIGASDRTANQEFGGRVALADGTAVIGRQGGANGGGAYLVVGSGATWTEEAIVSGSNAEAGDQNGSAVAIDGETVLIGAIYEDSAATGVDPTGTPGPDDNSAVRAGAAYVLTSSDWSLPSSDGGAVTAASRLALGTAPGPPVPGGATTFPVTGGDPGIEILWRLTAPDGTALLEGPVTLDADGRGVIELTLPADATGSLVLQLVAWGVEVPVDITDRPVPTSVRAGDGPGERTVPRSSGVPVAAALASIIALCMASRRHGPAVD